MNWYCVLLIISIIGFVWATIYTTKQNRAKTYEKMDQRGPWILLILTWAIPGLSLSAVLHWVFGASDANIFWGGILSAITAYFIQPFGTVPAKEIWGMYDRFWGKKGKYDILKENKFSVWPFWYVKATTANIAMRTLTITQKLETRKGPTMPVTCVVPLEILEIGHQLYLNVDADDAKRIETSNSILKAEAASRIANGVNGITAAKLLKDRAKIMEGIANQPFPKADAMGCRIGVASMDEISWPAEADDVKNAATMTDDTITAVEALLTSWGLTEGSEDWKRQYSDAWSKVQITSQNPKVERFEIDARGLEGIGLEGLRQIKDLRQGNGNAKGAKTT